MMLATTDLLQKYISGYKYASSNGLVSEENANRHFLQDWSALSYTDSIVLLGLCG